MNSSRLSGDLAPYRQFSKSEWAALRGGEKMTLSADDVVRLRALKTGLLIFAGVSLLAVVPASRLPRYRPHELEAPSPAAE